ncbi:asparagine synthase (glutamine-hydrolyzing) [Candidatus Uhrbacteria bacterium]|nr:asparagine synthase (glutamine-hydrolyzing) [Candidatus Uhrbacteria bacterium]
MCGILATYDPNGRLHAQTILNAAKSMSHRGPDHAGIWLSQDQTVGLAHRRLAITDINGGDQPLVSADGTIVASVNGELYGYKKIREELRQKGHHFKTESDSEIVIGLYQEYGLDFTKYLRGEFAFVLYDLKLKRLIAVRDRFGIKPLHYFIGRNGIFSVASEAKALLALGVPAAWDTYALFHASCLQYIPQDHSLFKNIYQLKPGHMLVHDSRNVVVTKYWDVDFPKDDEKTNLTDENLAAKTLESALKEAVTLRLQTDGPKVCFQVSGGIDSSIVAAMGAEALNVKTHCFTVSFPHNAYDETQAAARVAQHIGADFTSVPVGAVDVVNTLSDAVYYSEGLAINSHLAAKYILHQKIREAGYTIVLTGEGADEALAGYVHLKQDLLGNTVLGQGNADLVASGVHFPIGPGLDLNPVMHRLGYLPTFLKAKASIGFVMNGLLSKEWVHHFSPEQMITDFIQSIDVENQLTGRDHVNQSSYLWIKFAMANYILKTLGDGCEMAHSVEGRVPFLDHLFFDVAKRIPTNLKMKDGIQKHILRVVARNYLPEEVCLKPKQPFMAPPLSLVENRVGFEFINDVFHSQSFADMNIFDQTKAVRLLETTGDIDIEHQIAIEPIIMLMLSTYLIQNRFHLARP